MANNIIAGQGNCVVAKTAKTLAAYGFDDTNTSIIYQPGQPNKSWRPTGTLNSLTGVIPAGTGLYIIAKGTSQDKTADFHPDGTEGATGQTATAVTWGQLHLATDSGSGTITKPADVVTGTAENSGGTVVGKLAKVNGNYVEYNVPAPPEYGTAAVLALCSANNGSYIFGTDLVLASNYVYAPGTNSSPVTPVIKWATGDGATDGVAQTPAVAAKVVRMEIANTNDVLLKYDGTTVHTFTGVLNGITDIFIKAIFAGVRNGADPNSGVRVLQTVKALGVA